MYSLSISRIYHEFTIYFAIHYRSSFFFANSLWNYFKFSFDTYSLLIHFLFGVITIDTLFFREFTFCTSLFELTFFFREFTKNTPSASVIQDVFAIFFAKILWEHYPLHENTIRALSFIAKILWKHYAGVQLLIHHHFSSKEWTHDPKIEFSNSLSIKCQWIVRKLIFGPLLLVRTGSKVSFWSLWKRIKSGFSNKLSHVIINYEEKFGLIKSESSCICFTWLSSFTDFSGSKVGPARIFLRKYYESTIVFAPIRKSKQNWKQK